MAMVDLVELDRMNKMIAAINKMHNGLLALIDEHHQLAAKVTELEEKLTTLQGNAETRPS